MKSKQHFTICFFTIWVFSEKYFFERWSCGDYSESYSQPFVESSSPGKILSPSLHFDSNFFFNFINLFHDFSLDLWRGRVCLRRHSSLFWELHWNTPKKGKECHSFFFPKGRRRWQPVLFMKECQRPQNFPK